MNLDFTEDQKLLRETVARLFQAESTGERIRAAESQGFDPALWQQLVEMGIPMMRVPVESGGSELGLLDAALIAEEAGRHLASVPVAESIVAAELLANLDGEQASALLAKMAEGQLITLAPVEIGDTPVLLPGAGFATAHLALEADSIVVITGAKTAQTPNLGNMAIACLHPDAPDQDITKTVLARGTDAVKAFNSAREAWKILNAAMLVGVAQQSLKMAADYACERFQFDRLIGGYQGIAHPLADCLADSDSAQLLVWQAVWAIANGEQDAAATVSMARWWAAKTTAKSVAKALHTFGGYGVSLEYDIQLYYRRGKAWALLGGDPHRELDHLGARLWGGETVPLPDAGEVTIDFSCGATAKNFAAEVREFFEQNLTDELRAKAHHSEAGYDKAFCKKLAAAGLRYPHWPVEYGGRGVSSFDMSALNEVFEEYNWERLSGPVTNQVAQIVMRYANEDVKQEVIPRMASGDALACLGFSEPSSGSDIYAAKTRAVRDGDDWIINGQKIFTTIGNLADYIFLLTRTDPEVPKHKGMTIFLVPMDSPGVEIQPVYTLQDERTNITYLENVRISDRYRLGEVNGAMKVMLSTMELEHSGDQYRISFGNMYRHAVDWASNTVRSGQRMIDKPDVRQRLAQVAVHVTAARALCYKALWAVENQVPNRIHLGPMSKLFSTEYYHHDSLDMMDLAAPESIFQGNQGLGHVEIGYRQSIGTTIYGGTSEILRSQVAEHGLGLPKSRS